MKGSDDMDRRSLTDEEVKFVRGCYKWKDYKSKEEFADDVVKCLMFSSWQYSESEAKEIVDKIRKDYIEEAYRDKEPAYDTACEAGYFAG